MGGGDPLLDISGHTTPCGAPSITRASRPPWPCIRFKEPGRSVQQLGEAQDPALSHAHSLIRSRPGLSPDQSPSGHSLAMAPCSPWDTAHTGLFPGHQSHLHFQVTSAPQPVVCRVQSGPVLAHTSAQGWTDSESHTLCPMGSPHQPHRDRITCMCEDQVPGPPLEQ